jgi:hypothetical protein
MPHLIRAARTAQQRAARAARMVGPAHPLARLLLAAAAVTATAAWEAGHRVHDIHPARKAAGTRVADDLYTRYLAADRAWRVHASDCTSCKACTHCRAGAPLYERFARIQDAYLQRQKKR